MVKTMKRNKSIKRKRTSLEIEEEQSRTLYIRLPKTIKNVDDVQSLFFGEFQVKLPRQSSRHCHVIFSNVEEKIKNLKEIKKKQIDGKPIFAAPPRPINLEKPKKPKQKKIKIPEPTDESVPGVGKYLFISNIAPGVKASEIRDAFPGSVTVGLLKGLVNGTKQARVKMSASHLCEYYVKNEQDWPTLNGKKVVVSHSKKSKSKSKSPGKKSKSLKIYDGETEIKDTSKLFKKNKKSKDKDNEETEHDEKSTVEKDVEKGDGNEENEIEDNSDDEIDSDGESEGEVEDSDKNEDDEDDEESQDE